jgi:hypothetical protein
MTQLLYEYSYGALLGVPGGNVDAYDATDFLHKTNANGANVQTVGTITVGGTIGTANFVVSGLMNLPENPAYPFSTTVTANGTTIVTASDVATALVAGLNSDNTFYDVAYATRVAGVITITVRPQYTGVNPFTSFANTAGGSATITASPTLTSYTNAANVPYGYAVAFISGTDTDSEARLFTGSGTLLGVCGLLRSSEQSYNPYTNSNIGISQVSPVDYVPAGGQLAIKRKGRIFTLAVDAVTQGNTVYANNTTGQLQAASSGGTALTINGVTAVWGNNTSSAGQIAIVQL